jgi:hypothetical protein
MKTQQVTGMESMKNAINLRYYDSAAHLIESESPDGSDIHDALANTLKPIRRRGHRSVDNQKMSAPTSNPIECRGRALSDNHDNAANTFNPIAGEGPVAPDTQTEDANTCNLLRELHRQRQDLHRAEKSLTLQIKAKCRRLCGGDKTEADKVYKSMFEKRKKGKKKLSDAHEDSNFYDFIAKTSDGITSTLAMHAMSTSLPFINARALLESERKSTEKQMVKAAKTLPVYEWVESTRGFGALGFAQIVGECGDLSNYGTVSRLWKRLGLAVIEGGRQRRVTGPDALLHGYSPSRRSVVWNIGDSMFRSGGPYADLCRERKEYERATAAAQGLTVCPAAKIPKKGAELFRSDGHVHNRAKRYMEKRLMRDLWRAWRDYSVLGQGETDTHPSVAQC